jgi:hypothetical protein
MARFPGAAPVRTIAGYLDDLRFPVRKRQLPVRQAPRPLPSRILQQHFRALLGDHKRRRSRIARGDQRHGGGIDDA